MCIWCESVPLMVAKDVVSGMAETDGPVEADGRAMWR